MTKWKSPEELAKWQKARAKARAKSQLPLRKNRHGAPKGRKR